MVSLLTFWRSFIVFLTYLKLEEVNQVYSGLLRLRNGWSKFMDLLPLLIRRDLPLGTRVEIYSTNVCSIRYWNDSWDYRNVPIKEDNVIRVEINNTRMARWMCNVGPENNISAVELRNRLWLNSMRECLQNRRLL